MDRLEEIKKKDTKYQLGGTTLEADWKYLIQQAERVQELEQQNQFYKQALEEINFQASLDETSDNVQEAIDKALKGEANG
ncbi:hypothetical protein PD280_06230 [Virgibacillus salarius]|uniref:hypothetical protein n=1 Tax=Virgibacillus salarius TaxID=447199 RepID=UPI0003FC2EF6|nr:MULTISPECIES: hypothetical protein [Bacillaceae]WBX81315.1 hypothetical protein PD280_06230 [Virgibacillus salarius]